MPKSDIEQCPSCKSTDIERINGPFELRVAGRVVNLRGHVHRCRKCGNILGNARQISSNMNELTDM